jgi:trimeric autotransporter adhesin
MNKLISSVGSVGRERWRLKEVFVLVILLAVTVASTASTARASIHGGDTTRVAIGTTKPTLQVRNTATGVGALISNTTGDGNTATGWDALRSNTMGSGNTAMGAYALQHNTAGGSNTAAGWDALRFNTTGSNNTATGAYALQYNTAGGGNTATGDGALFSNTAGGGNTATGRGVLFSNTTGQVNTATGLSALFSNTTGSNNTATGRDTLHSNTTGSNNTGVGFGANVSVGNLINATAIGAGAIVNRSNKIRLGNTAVTVIEGQVGFTSSSDARQQENFLPVDREETLRKLRQLTVSSWNFKGQDPARFRHYGPNAQEFFAAFGHDDLGTIGNETTITSTDIDGIMLLAIQALEQRTVELQEELRKAREELAQLQAEKKAGVAEVESP